MHIEYHEVTRLPELEERSDILGIVCFGEAPAWQGMAPCLSVPLPPQQPGLCEVLYGGQATTGEVEGVRYAYDRQWLFATLSVPDDRGVCPAAVDAYGRLLRVAEGLGYPCLIRAWQYFSDIHGDEGGLERYRQFNRGRHLALAPYLAHGGLRPAATCVGSAGPGLVIYVLARTTPGTPVENPRQIAAYRYPEAYGPQAPDFVRAMKVEENGQQILWISGTAAIVGHESREPGDLAAQARETFVNLDRLVEHAGLGPSARALLSKIYIRGQGDMGDLPAFWRRSPVLVLQGDICRSELAIEIEAVISAGAPGV